MVIVDTSNEIGGDGDVPHPAIGNARRMQVADATRQHDVMVSTAATNTHASSTCIHAPCSCSFLHVRSLKEQLPPHGQQPIQVHCATRTQPHWQRHDVLALLASHLHYQHDGAPCHGLAVVGLKRCGVEAHKAHCVHGGPAQVQRTVVCAVQIEAVENHMPEILIVDEIGTEAEALACRTIAERGVVLIGTAHGCFLENLIKNPTLSGAAAAADDIQIPVVIASTVGHHSTAIPTAPVMSTTASKPHGGYRPRFHRQKGGLLKGWPLLVLLC